MKENLHDTSPTTWVFTRNGRHLVEVAEGSPLLPTYTDLHISGSKRKGKRASTSMARLLKPNEEE